MVSEELEKASADIVALKKEVHSLKRRLSKAITTVERLDLAAFQTQINQLHDELKIVASMVIDLSRARSRMLLLFSFQTVEKILHNTGHPPLLTAKLSLPCSEAIVGRIHQTFERLERCDTIKSMDTEIDTCIANVNQILQEYGFPQVKTRQ